jgi:glyoxylase-like metal-dependent hydrolase (beta-lactamase superfamily II)
LSISNSHFKVGSFDCRVISDGTILVSDSLSKIPEKAAQSQKYPMDILSLYINTGKHKVLIDTGCGAGLHDTNGKLLENLLIEGIKPSDIDVVIHSHGHIDHIGGNLNSQGRQVFPRARYVIHPLEFAYWEKRVAEAPANETSMFVIFARKQLIPLKGKIHLISDSEEIVPGIKSILAPGHTPGNTILEISSGTERLLFIGDVAHSPDEFTRPELFTHIDCDSGQAKITREIFLAEAAESRVKIAAAHFPFPGLGYIQKKNHIFIWNPA